MYTTKECQEWKNNPNINPKTKRIIKTEGPTFKKIKQMCAGGNDSANRFPDSAQKNRRIPVEKLAWTHENTIYLRGRHVPKTLNGYNITHILDSDIWYDILECVKDKKKYLIKYEVTGFYRLEDEYEFYKRMKNTSLFIHLPKIIEFKSAFVYKSRHSEDIKLNYCVIEYLDEFDRESIANFYALLDAIKSINDIGYAHMNINFHTVRIRKSDDVVVFVDYLFAAKYSNKINVLNKVGDYKYRSLFSHKGIVTGRNDLENLFYLLYDTYVSALPWPKAYSEKPHVVAKKKREFLKEISRVPKAERSKLEKFASYINSLQVKDKVNYDIIYNIFND